MPFCGPIPVEIYHILQGYFTGNGAIIRYPWASDKALPNLGKYNSLIHKERLHDLKKMRLTKPFAYLMDILYVQKSHTHITHCFHYSRLILKIEPQYVQGL